MEAINIPATMVLKSEETKVALLEERIGNLIEVVTDLKSDVKEMKNDLAEKYVKNQDFLPVKQTVESLNLWVAKTTGIAIAAAVVVDYIIRILTKN